MFTADSLVTFGGAVKALPDGKVVGQLVRFSSATAPDLTGDFFTPSTDFDVDDWSTVIKGVYYAHGQDAQIGKRRIGKASLKHDELGVWVEAQLDLADEYQAAIYEMAKQDKLGWSSGSVAHLVERKAVTDDISEITRWPLAEASLTPQPAEPRNVAVASLKSLVDTLSNVQPQAGRPLDEHSSAVLATARDYRQRIASLKALRKTENRDISEKSRKAIASTADELEVIAEALKALALAPEKFADEGTAARLYAEFLFASGDIA